MMHADFYIQSWLIYSLTSAIFLILLYFMLKLFFKSFWVIGCTWTTFAAALLTPIDNSVETVNAMAPAVMVMGLSGMDNLFTSTPDWTLTLNSMIYLGFAIIIAQLLLIIGRMTWTRIKSDI